MKRLLLLLGVTLFCSVPVFADVEIQTSWYLGPGELGPVLHWDERFYDSDSLAHTIEGQLSLIASSVDYNSWTKHVIESNVNIESHGNPVPADMDDDGDLDIVAIIGGSENSVVWYENTGGGYVKHSVGTFVNGVRATTWPYDLDKDGDYDIVASGDEGLAWFENQSLSFTEHTIDATERYLYARLGDVDNDGDIDIVTHDKSQGILYGDLWLFTNDGTMGFSRKLIYNSTWGEIWRINLADFNGDSFVDIQTSMSPVYVFLNDKTGNFTKAYTYSGRIDGSWPSDFDADGDVDIMCATFGGGSPPVPVFWLENDGTGLNFSYHYVGGDNGDYGDGGMAIDMNLDGLMDALGTYRYVGWFEQLPSGDFVEHRLPNSYFYDSHWVYGANLDKRPCSGEVDIDVVAAKNGEYAMWENEMVTFATNAWLESSILEPGVPASWGGFGWSDHVPDGNEVRYRVRSGNTVPELLAAPWSSPVLFSGDALSNYGISTESYLQYRIELERTTGLPDRSPTVYEIWVEWDSILPSYKVTGGGWIPGEPPGPGDKRTFGFNAHSEGDSTWGQLQFNDHATKMKVHTTSVDTLAIYGDTVADFAGECRVDGVSGYTFYCEVEDRGEPGRGVDKFSIEVYDSTGSPYYSAGDILAGGNIQIHKISYRTFSGYETEQVSQVRLYQNAPNPFRSFTFIKYELRSPTPVTINIYDLSGKLVRTLLSANRAAGLYAVEWDGKSNSGNTVTTGIYLYRLSAGRASRTGKMIFLK